MSGIIKYSANLATLKQAVKPRFYLWLILALISCLPGFALYEQGYIGYTAIQLGISFLCFLTAVLFYESIKIALMLKLYSLDNMALYVHGMFWVYMNFFVLIVVMNRPIMVAMAIVLIAISAYEIFTKNYYHIEQK